MTAASCPSGTANVHRKEIEALSAVASKEQAIFNLRKILSCYGSVLSIEQLPTAPGDSTFLVDFERIEDAISAATDLKYCLFGYSTLIIPLQEAASPSIQTASG